MRLVTSGQSVATDASGGASYRTAKVVKGRPSGAGTPFATAADATDTHTDAAAAAAAADAPENWFDRSRFKTGGAFVPITGNKSVMSATHTPHADGSSTPQTHNPFAGGRRSSFSVVSASASATSTSTSSDGTATAAPAVAITQTDGRAGSERGMVVMRDRFPTTPGRRDVHPARQNTSLNRVASTMPGNTVVSQPLRIQCFQLHPMSAMTFDTAAQSTDGQGLSTQVGVRACVHACVRMCVCMCVCVYVLSLIHI